MTDTTTDPEVEPNEEPIAPESPPESPPDEHTTGTPGAHDEQDDEHDTFPRSYVQELRDEAAKYRQRAARADDLAAALWAARVEATGRLADPSDLAMPEDGDPLDEQAVTAAVEELLARKPHLASRRPRGDVGQGTTGTTTAVDLAGLLRAGT